MEDRDNQQRRMDDLNWLGGIIDGEGMVTMIKQTQKNKLGFHSYVPRISVVNTDIIMIQEVCDILGENNIPHFVQTLKSKQNPNWRLKFEVIIGGLKRCKKALDILLPFIRTKNYKAEKLLEFINYRLKLPCNYPATKKDYEFAHLIKNAFITPNDYTQHAY